MSPGLPRVAIWKVCLSLRADDVFQGPTASGSFPSGAGGMAAEPIVWVGLLSRGRWAKLNCPCQLFPTLTQEKAQPFKKGRRPGLKQGHTSTGRKHSHHQCLCDKHKLDAFTPVLLSLLTRQRQVGLFPSC